MIGTGGSAEQPHRAARPGADHDCVHCGFCLPTCPSYAVFEDEMDSPRGRIVLMRVGHEAGAEISAEMVTHFDRCLGCMACVTACPSGVQYDRLIERTGRSSSATPTRSRRERAFRRAIFALLHPPRPAARARAVLRSAPRSGSPTRSAARLRAAAVAARRRALAAGRVRATPAPAAARSRRAGTPRGRVALMQGCVQRVFFGDVNAATVRVLAAEGWEVHAPRRRAAAARCSCTRRRGRGARRWPATTIAAYEGFDASRSTSPAAARR